MALKYIPASWRIDMRTNFAHVFNFYINPRGRVFPALTSAGISYIKNDATTNMRGTYRMQTDATTDLTYLYTLPQRFIIEGWFKPEFAYNVAGNQTIFQCGDAAEFSIIYNATTDTFDMIQSPGTTISSGTFTSDALLQQWIYIRAFYDNSAKMAGLFLRVGGVVNIDTENVPGAGTFVPLNTISFFPGVILESSYWVIHELDETIASNRYQTYKADRQIIFDFNGLTLGRERIRIPAVHKPNDNRGVKSFSFTKNVENPTTGHAGANTASLTLHNTEGQFSDDQYDTFDPFNGYYNGPQKYLQNRVPVEIESQSKRTQLNNNIGILGQYNTDISSSICIDNSGAGSHLNTTDIATSASGLIFNGSTSYMRTTKPLASFPDVFTFGWKMPNGHAQQAYYQTFFNYKPTGSGLIFLYREIATGELNFAYYNGLSTSYLIFSSFFTGYSAASLDAYIAANFTNAAKTFTDPQGNTATIPAYGVMVFCNGVQFGATKYMTTPVKPLAGSYLYVGAYQGANYFLNGTIGEIILLNRFPTSYELAGVYPVKAYSLSDYTEDQAETSGYLEPLFIGHTTPGAFKRTSPDKFYGSVSIDAEDAVAEMGEMKLSSAHAFDGFDLSDPVSETTSLVHSIARLATKKEIRNYVFNSNGDNATPSNSWTASGLTLTRDGLGSYSQFGPYSLKAVSTAAGDYFRQVIKFETTDLIDIGDIFNLSAYIYQGTASMVKIQIEELTSAGALVGAATETACGTDTGIFTKVNVYRTILSSTCTQLRITFMSLGASTFYTGGVMLIRGIDPIDYAVINDADGTSGSGSADNAAVEYYDTVAIDADAVDIVHPYAMLAKNTTPWTALKKIGDASIARYIGMTPDGVFHFDAAINEADPSVMADIEDVGAIGTSLEIQSANSIKVYGAIIEKETAVSEIWNIKNVSGIVTDSGGSPKNPILNGAYLSIAGATTIEAVYEDAD